MSQTLAAKRYANALFQIAKEENQIDRLETEIRTVKDVFETNGRFIEFLEHPKVSMENKKQAIAEAFATASPSIQNLLMLLVERHRETIVPDLADEFILLVNEHTGIVDAKVYSVKPLSNAEQEGISKVFARKIGKQALRIENIVDSSLLGGIKIRIGNRIFDGTVQGKLDRLERSLLG
ncbi:ATP synthase F0F1 subunit delta [Bacillus sp. FJAT-27916]|uniref:F0F1 ATP synthase subunit delta n=1 Tax=Bacillus sp. FJAT-27916 TaxID=1679169 RepID=UPI0006707DBA|nr:F0F1 ATP synthase subunit delta [Bacillus sp. FJAT-27916]KMY42961.1 ATP synthase F0F1 subunit delta [Bacillus sp. FJAT-27916]